MTTKKYVAADISRSAAERRVELAGPDSGLGIGENPTVEDAIERREDLGRRIEALEWFVAAVEAGAPMNSGLVVALKFVCSRAAAWVQDDLEPHAVAFRAYLAARDAAAALYETEGVRAMLRADERAIEEFKAAVAACTCAHCAYIKAG